jgi:NitT/TauT family transport system substrate-binding protein
MRRNEGGGSLVRVRRFWWLALPVVVLALLAAGCGGDDEEAGGTTAAETTAEAAAADVTLQLKWVTQAQFAGYYAALEQGYYDDENLNVTIKPGGPDIVPEQVVLGNQAEFGINWPRATRAARSSTSRRCSRAPG